MNDERETQATVAITGAAGKTGRAVADALLARGVRLRLLARGGAQADALAAQLASVAQVEVVPGDLRDGHSLRRLLHGAQAVYHICPNMAPDEEPIGVRLIEAAQVESLRAERPLHVVYHSVLHPQTPEMPHHWNKMLVEGRLWSSGLPVTILQPAAYMQNVLAGRRRIAEEGVYAVPYAPETRVGMVALQEVAEVAAKVLCEPQHRSATYELANGEALTQAEVAAILAEAMGRPVRAEATPRAAWKRAALAGGMDPAAVGTLLKMFRYYEDHGFSGAATTLRHLLGREPLRFADWAHSVAWDAPATG